MSFNKTLRTEHPIKLLPRMLGGVREIVHTIYRSDREGSVCYYCNFKLNRIFL